MLLAFFGCLRVREFAATSRARVHAHVLQVGDIHFLGPNQGSATESVLVSLRHSKNNQHGPPQQIHIGQAIDASPCPVHALKGFLKVRPRMHGILFCRTNGLPLTQFQFNKVLQKALSRVGVQGAHFRFHSFRMGAASTAFSLGVPVEVIKRMGRWRSDALLRYIRPFPGLGFLGN